MKNVKKPVVILAVAVIAIVLVLVATHQGANGSGGSSGGIVSPFASDPFDEKSATADLTTYDESGALEYASASLGSKDVKVIRVDPTNWSAEGLVALHEACPTAVIEGTYSLGSLQVPLDAEEVDLKEESIEELDAFASIAPCMTNLKTVAVGDEDAHTKLAAASRIKQANPDVNVDYTFVAYGLRLDVNQTKLDFRQVPIEDNGDEVRDLLTSMPQVTDLDMDSSGVDNEHMASIRDDYPNVNVVWRVWFGPNDVYTVRTDVEKILASNEGYGWLTPENDQALKYCTKVKYLDLGHNGSMGDISFINYMPDLEVFICSLGGVEDISPVANCPHMEYLECFGNYITDLSPIANCHELKHLNVVNNTGVSDIMCLDDLDLERFWLGGINQVPYEQAETYMAHHPNCNMRLAMSNPHEDYRWGNPRYDLLVEQMGYDTLDFQTAEHDPLTEPRTDIPWANPPESDNEESTDDGEDEWYAEDEGYTEDEGVDTVDAEYAEVATEQADSEAQEGTD